MNVENAKAQMKKGILEMCILGIISKGEAYPSDIIKELKQAELIIVEGTLYPLLNRLKNAGFLDYNWKESKSGPPRKYYKMTENGTTFLATLKESWGQLVNAVDITTKNVTTSNE
ncbi:MAG: PadR family transcriptional regulator [Saprospiraceae bacterium]|nr:PadR family transcriptional regulator [Saprospiraceae bacterium]